MVSTRRRSSVHRASTATTRPRAIVARLARQLAEIGRQDDRGGRRRRQRTRWHSHSRRRRRHVHPRTSRIASAARRLAPGPPSRARTRASPSRIRAARAGSVSIEIASSATASGVNAILNQLRHDPLAGDQVDHRRTYRASRGGGRVDRSTATVDRRRPSACRASPSAPWPCLTRSARRRPTPGPRRSLLATTTAGDQAARFATSKRSIVQVRRARDHELRAGTARANPPAAATRSGRIRLTSFGRLPGRIATVGACGASPRPRRNASRGAAASRDRRADGRRTRRARRLAGRSLLRTERSRARDPRRCASSSAGRDARPRSAG